MKLRKLLATFAIVLSVAAVTVTSAQTRIKISRSPSSISGSLDKFASRSYIFTNPGGNLLRAEITSRNNCVKFGGGDTTMNLALQSSDNYLDIRNDCGMTLTFKISYRVE